MVNEKYETDRKFRANVTALDRIDYNYLTKAMLDGRYYAQASHKRWMRSNVSNILSIGVNKYIVFDNLIDEKWSSLIIGSIDTVFTAFKIDCSYVDTANGKHDFDNLNDWYVLETANDEYNFEKLKDCEYGFYKPLFKNQHFYISDAFLGPWTIASNKSVRNVDSCQMTMSLLQNHSDHQILLYSEAMLTQKKGKTLEFSIEQINSKFNRMKNQSSSISKTVLSSLSISSTFPYSLTDDYTYVSLG